MITINHQCIAAAAVSNLAVKTLAVETLQSLHFVDNGRVEKRKTIFVMMDTGSVPVFKFNNAVRKYDRVVYRFVLETIYLNGSEIKTHSSYDNDNIKRYNVALLRCVKKHDTVMEMLYCLSSVVGLIYVL